MIAKQALVYYLAVFLEIMHKKWSSAKKHLWKLEQLTLKNLLPWLVKWRFQQWGNSEPLLSVRIMLYWNNREVSKEQGLDCSNWKDV